MTPEALLARRRMMDAAALRRGPPRAAHQRTEQPRGPTVQYTALLLRLVRELTEAARAELRAEGVLSRADGADDQPLIPPRRAAGITSRLQALADRLISKRAWLTPLEDISDAVQRFSQVQFQKQVKGAIGQVAFERIAKTALGVDLFGDDLELSEERDGFRRENVALIKSLADEHVQRVSKVLSDAGSGTRVEDLTRRIREATGASESRAALIARDQVLSLNADITRARHEAAGITHYVWRTSHDERVREGHRLLDGKTFAYDDPPVVDPRSGRRAHPGTDFQCRCTADPIIEGFEEEPPAPSEVPETPAPARTTRRGRSASKR